MLATSSHVYQPVLNCQNRLGFFVGQRDMASCISDIEDISGATSSGDILTRGKHASGIVLPKVRRLNSSEAKRVSAEVRAATINGEGLVPGTASLWVKTFGCSHNISDGEYMEGQLSRYGYKFVKDKDTADLWLLNSCTVKNPSELSSINLVKEAKKKGKKVVVSGCVPQGDRHNPGLEGISLIGVSQIDRVVEVVEETLRGNTVRLLKKKALPKLDLPKVRRDRLIEIVPLSTGCLGSCTYCKTRHARGKLGSYSLDTIVSRIKAVVDEGEVSEIWLSSEDTGAWGIDLGMALPDLLAAVVRVLPKDQSVMLRLGMTNPPYMLQHLDAIADALNHPAVFSFLHVPVQSGSNFVLEKMNREYTIEDFCKVADHLLRACPGMVLATDVICGFPGERQADHAETVDLVKKYQFPVLNISQFYPRPGTPAKSMKQIDSKLKKARSREMTSVFYGYENLPKMLPTGLVCVAWGSTERGKSPGQCVAHTKSYVKVIIDANYEEIVGRKIEVKITGHAKFHATANVVRLFPRRIAANDSYNGLHRSVPEKKTDDLEEEVCNTCGGIPSECKQAGEVKNQEEEEEEEEEEEFKHASNEMPLHRSYQVLVISFLLILLGGVLFFYGAQSSHVNSEM